jgi:hypothetical protein
MFASGGRYGSSTWEAQLKDSSGRVVVKPQQIVAQTVAWESTIMAAIPRNFGGTPTFPGVKQNRPELKPEVARATVDQFPDNPIALEGLNAIYLNSEKALDLKLNQVTALLGWVRSGGQLIVAVEQLADVNSTPWLKQFAPMDLAETTNLKIDQEIADWVKSGSEANRDVDSVSQLNRPKNRRNTAQQGSAYANIPGCIFYNQTRTILNVSNGKPINIP